MNRALVISGGGNKGSWAVGLLKYLVGDLKREYNLFIGTSTGALIVPLIAANKLETLEKVYSTTKQSDIFKFSPVKVISNDKGFFTTKMKYLEIGWRLVTGRKTFGDSTNLINFIKKNFTLEDFNNIIKEGKNVIVTTTNLTKGKVEYKTNRLNNYLDFVGWMFASASFAPFMSLYSYNNSEYVDGGLEGITPLQKAIELGAEEIDVIVLRQESEIESIPKVSSVFTLIMRMIDLLSAKVDVNDFEIGKLNAKNKDVKLNIYYLPRKLTNNSLIFDAETMKSWMEEAYNWIKNKEIVCSHYIIKKDNRGSNLT